MEIIFSFILPLIPLIIAITIHEFAHAYAADTLGDPTPRSMGRLSLNPLRHLDPIGTIMLFIAHFGWGKPVPIDPYNLKNPKRDELLIALAGPASNLILSLALSILLRFLPPTIFSPLVVYLIQFNIALAIFNLLPIPPLDGSKIFINLLPSDWSYKWQEAFNQYGTLLLIAFIIPINGSSIAGNIITPIIQIILNLFLP